ncbi:MAG: site-specific DNA-methyltransferase [Candidatus Marinimicrobia bacterium]|nr:site-specific DNA-methyltransferase [Candidatus Neomarinimicrobiota bacterium]MBL7191166.1 site-specific DNA-methyltransferase [bacterium]
MTNKELTYCKILQGDCLQWLKDNPEEEIHLTFLDPPFNQGKEYRHFNDNLPQEQYWGWLGDIIKRINEITVPGGAIYFMQREKNTEEALRILRETGWEFQNLIIWRKKTSAIPCDIRFGKQYQIIVFATKGRKPRVFNKLRINPPLPPEYKHDRENGIYVTDVWDDIRELTSGYFAGDEAIRDDDGKRIHTQQSPIALLLRIILSSSIPGDCVFDPFSGSGTTLTAASQLNRKAVGIEVDPHNVELIRRRISQIRPADEVGRFRKEYIYTENLSEIWGEQNLEMAINYN